MIQFLNQPYPFEYSIKKSCWIIIGTSLFVTFFLYLFAPFGLHVFSGLQLLMICLQFGLVTGGVMSVFYFFIIPSMGGLFNEDNWTVLKHIIWVSILFIFIAVANTVLMYATGLRNFSWTTFLNAVWQVSALGIIISALIVSLDYLRHYKKNQREVSNLQITPVPAYQDNTSIQLTSDNEKEQLHLNTDELLYLTSADNYVEVIYKSGDNLAKKLLRGTLKQMQNQIEQRKILRCHRSYIVNLRHVIAVEGNAQGYQLTLRGTSNVIPVSRTYKKQVMRALEKV